MQKRKFVNIHIPVIQFPFTQYTAIYCPMQYIYRSIKVSVLNCIALYRIAILLRIDIL